MLLTEALQQIETTKKRIDKKRTFVQTYARRFSYMVDPFEKDGGAEKLIAEAMQAIADLEQRVVSLRAAIQDTNERTMLTVGKTTKSIADWFVWKREILANQEMFVRRLLESIQSARRESEKKKQGSGENDVERDSWDLILHVNEKSLIERSEELEEIKGNLDAQLSIKNATISVEWQEPGDAE